MGNNVSVCNKDRYGNDDAFKSLLGRFSSGLVARIKHVNYVVE